MSKSLTRFDLPDVASVAALAAEISPKLKKGDVLRLEGDLGAGKTTFARALIKHLSGGGVVEVPSPTFTLVQEYALPQFTLFHFDLYRLKHSDEVIEIGLEHALEQGVSVIEWPELADPFLPENAMTLKLEFKASSQGRVALFYSA